MNCRTIFLVWALVLSGLLTLHMFVVAPNNEQAAYKQGYLDALTWCNETFQDKWNSPTDEGQNDGAEDMAL